MPSKNKIVAVFVAVLFPISVFASTFSPLAVSSVSDLVSFSLDAGQMFCMVTPDGTEQNGVIFGDTSPDTWEIVAGDVTGIVGTWHVVLGNDTNFCEEGGTGNWPAILDDPDYLGEYFSVVFGPAGFSLVSSGVVSGFLGDAGAAVVTTGLTLWPIAAVVMGILIAFWVISRVIALFPSRKQ